MTNDGSKNTRDIATVKQEVNVVFDVQGVKVYYDGCLALLDVNMKIIEKQITAFIGPSGCGKSTLLRCFNRMNDLIPGAKVEGRLIYHEHNIYNSKMNSVK